MYWSFNKTKLDVFLYDRRFDFILDVFEIGFYKTLSSLYQLTNSNDNNNNICPRGGG